MANLFKVLSVNTVSEINIGDYIQAVASAQFLPAIDGYIEREELKDYSEEECNVIMNGWYMHNAEHWPPSNKINPLFVAFHINVMAQDKMTSSDSISYLKHYEPIGCRDIRTVKLLKDHGVEAYFSGCLTLTLGRKYHSNETRNRVIFSDAFCKVNWNIPTCIKLILHGILHIGVINGMMLRKKWGVSRLSQFFHASAFHIQYYKFVPTDWFVNGEYIGQQYPSKGETPAELMDDAKSLIKKFATAKVVITSRIHCALPCLGLETPVIYVHYTHNNIENDCRLQGIIELFNVVEWSNGKILDKNNFFKAAINGKLTNKEDWKILAEKLSVRCETWVKSCLCK